MTYFTRMARAAACAALLAVPATGLAAERLTTLLRRRGIRVIGGVMVILFGLWTMPGPHQQWLMGHSGVSAHSAH